MINSTNTSFRVAFDHHTSRLGLKARRQHNHRHCLIKISHSRVMTKLVVYNAANIAAMLCWCSLHEQWVTHDVF